MDKKIVDREMKSHIRSDIGDIRVELIRDDDTSEYGVKVWGKVGDEYKQLEFLEYTEREDASNEYYRLRNLIGRIAAIHPLIARDNHER